MARSASKKLSPKVTLLVSRTYRFTHAQVDYLAKKSSTLGLATSELIRRIIDDYRERSPIQ